MTAQGISQIRPAMALAIGTWSLMYLLNLTLYFLAAGPPPSQFVTSTAMVCILGMLFSTLLYFIARRVSECTALGRGVVLTLAVVILAGILAFIDASGAIQIGDAIQGSKRSLSVSAQAVNNFAIMVWQFGLLAAAYAMLEAYRVAQDRLHQLADARQQAIEAEGAATAARLAALRYQLNPHFLFNTMNSISSLVVTRRNREAEEMLARLSEFLRATLAGDPNELVSIDAELSTLQTYLEVESLRFGDRLAVEVNCPPELREALLPGFLLQPLVENAIKHGVAPSRHPVNLRIAVRAETPHRLSIAVSDDASRVGDSKRGTGTGVGHANVRERLRVLYGSEAALDAGTRDDGYTAAICLPLTMSRQGEPVS
ncbi:MULTISPECIES: histidine kinase [unclassified Sphingopyxis]|jgi:sensor histidine kinase YesM|uniref:sensor histidine kinase n=1 Tax=unclassified Sphingopyxis TaxID=2614943 RepID=UPI0024AC95D8|nr:MULTISPECIES: histidine kinase [unclassified Sphingopyxis]